MKRKLSVIAAIVIAATMTGCGYNNKRVEETSASETGAVQSDVQDVQTGVDIENTGSQVTLYTGREVSSDTERAIYKFNCTIPDGFTILEDDANGRYFKSDSASIMVKAQNYKEEFTDLATFADSAMGKIVYGNMLYQSDTKVSDPIVTKVAGFDCIRYDYDITSYFYNYETDAEGSAVTNSDGGYNVLSTDVISELSNSIYFFYSDEDVFYFIFETTKANREALDPIFDAFVASVNITPPGQENEPRKKVEVFELDNGIYGFAKEDEEEETQSAAEETTEKPTEPVAASDDTSAISE